VYVHVWVTGFSIRIGVGGKTLGVGGKVQVEPKECPWGGAVQECAPPGRFVIF